MKTLLDLDWSTTALIPLAPGNPLVRITAIGLVDNLGTLKNRQELARLCVDDYRWQDGLLVRVAVSGSALRITSARKKAPLITDGDWQGEVLSMSWFADLEDHYELSGGPKLGEGNDFVEVIDARDILESSCHDGELGSTMDSIAIPGGSSSIEFRACAEISWRSWTVEVEYEGGDA